MSVTMAERNQTEPARTLRDQPGRFSVYDLDRMPDDGQRYEIIDGMLFVSAAPGWLHQRAVMRLGVLLDRACPAGFEVLPGPFAVEFSENTRFEPDIVVTEPRHYNHRGLFTAPLLAVEMASDSTRMYDRNTKLKTYEREGTGSYWLVEPSARPAEARIEAWVLGESGAFELVADVTGDDVFEATLPYPVSIRPADLVRES